AVFVETVEALAQSDASTAWLVAQGCGCTLSSVFVRHDVAREIFGPANAILAWGPSGSGARAVAAEGGWRVSGHWNFASGNRNAQWLGGHCTAYGADGAPLAGPDGKEVALTVLFPRHCAQIEDTWQVIGLRGTGSDSYGVDDLFVPAERSYRRGAGAETYEHGPLYQFTAMNIFAFGVAGISLGIARSMLREFMAVAATKAERATGTPLRMSGSVQSGLARAQARLLSSRSLLLATARELYQVAETGRAFTFDERTRMRLCTVWAASEAREAADFAYHAAGAAAIFESGPFERRYRDMHTVSQQVQAHAANFELVGRAMLGVPVTSHLL
ncbi:MAG: acyl-CoA dehydrogenase family protein, partial [Hyphomicrobiaceae bacterium]